MRIWLRISFVCVFMIALIFSVTQIGAGTAEATVRNMTVTMVNVDGAGFIVQLPDGKNMVVDAGVSADLQTFFDSLDNLGITKIDYLVGTHQHSDHIANFDNILNNYTVDKIIYPAKAPANSTDYVNMKNAADNHGVTIKKVDTGRGQIFPDVTLDNGLVLSSYVYSPAEDFDVENYDPGTAEYINSYSLMFSIKYGTRGILFAGDAMPNAQDYAMDNYQLKDMQILVAPHHGWYLSQNSDFYDYLISKQFNTVLIPNNTNQGSVTNYKTVFLQPRNLRYWSTYHNNTMYIRSDGDVWWAGEAAEWQGPGWQGN